MGANSPNGRRWMTLKAKVYAMHGPICHLCLHPIIGKGGTVDHIVPTSIDPDLAWDLANLRPAHGINNRCRECVHPVTGKPLACNDSRKARTIEAFRAWAAGTPLAPVQPAPLVAVAATPAAPGNPARRPSWWNDRSGTIPDARGNPNVCRRVGLGHRGGRCWRW